MKYIAIIDDEMLSDFRIDEPILCNGMSVNDKVMVVTDKLGFTRAIQLKPLKKGHWMKSNIGGAKVCSVCNAHMGLSGFKFCPNCGAEMGEK